MARKDFENFNNSNFFEGLVSVSAVINAMENGKTDRKIEKVFFDSSKTGKKARELAYLTRKAKIHKFPIELVDGEFFKDRCISSTHGGIAAECSNRTILPLSDLRPKEKGFYVMVEGIEDPYNFGNAMRSLYAAGIDAVILSPRNWMGVAGIVARSSAGASELSELYISDGQEAADFFKEHGYKVVCADMDNSVSIYEADMSYPIFLIVGGEKRGISSALRKKCDIAVRLDYGRDFKNALSAESATSIIAFETYRQNNCK